MSFRTDVHPPSHALLLVSGDRGDATDRSSYSRTPTVSSGATFATRAIDFDGTSNAVITYPDANELETFPLSVAGWWRNDASTNANGVSLITKASIAASPSVNYRGWYFTYITGTTGALGLRVSIVEDTFDQYRTWSNRTSYDDSTWRHIAFTLDTVGGTPAIYVNGVAQTLYASLGPVAPTTVVTPDPVRLGGRAYFEQNTYFNGALDNVRIYSRVLSAVEINGAYIEGLGVTRP